MNLGLGFAVLHKRKIWIARKAREWWKRWSLVHWLMMRMRDMSRWFYWNYYDDILLRSQLLLMIFWARKCVNVPFSDLGLKKSWYFTKLVLLIPVEYDISISLIFRIYWTSCFTLFQCFMMNPELYQIRRFIEKAMSSLMQYVKYIKSFIALMYGVVWPKHFFSLFFWVGTDGSEQRFRWCMIMGTQWRNIVHVKTLK